MVADGAGLPPVGVRPPDVAVLFRTSCLASGRPKLSESRPFCSSERRRPLSGRCDLPGSDRGRLSLPCRSRLDGGQPARSESSSIIREKVQVPAERGESQRAIPYSAPTCCG